MLVSATGTPSHLSVLESTAQAVAEDNPNELQFRTFKPKSNSGVKTYDGVDVCASREAFEVEAEVARLEHEAGNGRKVKEISVAGYSCGGREWQTFYLMVQSLWLVKN